MIFEFLSFIAIVGWIITGIKLVCSIKWIKKRQTEYEIHKLLLQYGYSDKEFDEFLYSIPDLLYWNIGFLVLMSVIRILSYVF